MKPYALPLSLIASTLFLMAAVYPHFDADRDQLLQQIGSDYLSYPKFELKEDSMRWKVAYCEPFSGPSYTEQVHSSLSERVSVAGKGPHAMELYRLYVKDLNAYMNASHQDQPTGQVMVKETWWVQEVPTDSLEHYHGKVSYNIRTRGWYRAVKRDRLFVMMKPDRPKGADKGWVYAVMEASQPHGPRTIIQAGKIASCMSCHKDAGRDRTFGPDHQERP
jgi:hypothetical protein